MTTIADVCTIGITVQNQDEALAFYAALGFETRMDGAASPTMRWLEVAPPGATVTLALVAGRGPGEAGGEVSDTGVRFNVPDARAERDALEAAGAAVGDLLEWDGVPPMFTFDDPDGNRFTVVEVA